MGLTYSPTPWIAPWGFGTCDHMHLRYVDVIPSPVWSLSPVFELSFTSLGVGSYNFPLVALHTISIISFHLWCMLGGSVEVWTKTCYIGTLRANLILAPLDMPTQVWCSMNWYRKSLFKPPHYLQACTGNLPSMEVRVCKTTNSQPKVMLSRGWLYCLA